jgi:hypothetical protein
MPKSYKVTTDNLRPEMAEVWRIVSKGVLSAPVVVTLDREGKTRQQEEKYHAMINDIMKHGCIEHYDSRMELYKGGLIVKFANDLKEQGLSLRNPGRRYLCPDRQEWITDRPRSSDFGKKEAAMFIEWLYHYGTEYKVVWSDDLTSSLAEAYGQE